MADVETVSVKVYVRLRPLLERELAECGGDILWKYNKKALVEDTGSGTKTRTFDGVLSPESSNQDAYDLIAKDMVEKSMTGHNATIFAYGQTGSGKTWTMMGPNESVARVTPEAGIVPRLSNHVFSRLREMLNKASSDDGHHTTPGNNNARDRTPSLSSHTELLHSAVSVSFLEIYNEQVRDLLGDAETPLPVKWNPHQGFYVHKIKTVSCSSKADVMR